MDVSENSGFSPQIIQFNRVFYYKPSILGYHYFWKHPYPKFHSNGIFFAGSADEKFQQKPGAKTIPNLKGCSKNLRRKP